MSHVPEAIMKSLTSDRRSCQAVALLVAVWFLLLIPGIEAELNSTISQIERTTVVNRVPRAVPEARVTGGASDVVTGYYDFLINEGSYKFWAVFQLFTAALLIYSAFAAVYYAKYTFATTDYTDYEDDFFFRRAGTPLVATTQGPGTFLGLSPATYQMILDAISSKKYS